MASMKKRKPTYEEKNDIMDAAETGKVDIIEILASRGVDVTGVVDDAKTTALHGAAYDGHCNVVACLLDHGASVNDVTMFKHTALHLAAMNGHYKVVDYLLSRGAKVNDVTSVEMWTPLHYAAHYGHAEIAHLLVKNKASISKTDKENRTPLQLAVERGESDVVYFFIKQQKMDITQFDDKTQQKIDELVKRAEKKQATQPLLVSPKQQVEPDVAHELDQLEVNDDTDVSGASVNAQLVKGAVVIGQIMDKQSTPTMRDLNRYVITDYAVDWEKIGIELGVQPKILKIISADNQQKCEPCFRSMLDKWLELNPKATWSTLEVAITNVNRTSNRLSPVTDVYGTSKRITS